MKKTMFGISLIALALVAVALVPATTTTASAQGLFSEFIQIGADCEKNVCINSTNCETTSDQLGCKVHDNGRCSTYRCAASIGIINN